MTNMQRVEFDYEQLNLDTRIVVDLRTREIKALMKRTAQDIIEIGQRLIEVKKWLRHGQFGAWLEAEFRWTDRTARKYMSIARSFKSEEVFRFENVGFDTLALLAASSTPDDARQEAIDRAQQGEEITHAKAQEIVEAHKLPQPHPPVNYMNLTEGMTPEDWAKVDRQADEMVRQQEAEEEARWAAMSDEEKEQADRKAKEYVDRIFAPAPPPDEDDMRPEYDFSQGVRGKHAARYAEGVEYNIDPEQPPTKDQLPSPAPYSPQHSTATPYNESTFQQTAHPPRIVAAPQPAPRKTSWLRALVNRLQRWGDQEPPFEEFLDDLWESLTEEQRAIAARKFNREVEDDK